MTTLGLTLRTKTAYDLMMDSLRYEFALGDVSEIPVYDIPLERFIGEAWRILEPETPFSDNWHIGYLSEYLEAITAGELTRLIINLPPRHMKSLLVSVMWPCWEWVTKPTTRFIFASYSGDLAIKHSVDRRTLLSSPWYQREFPGAVTLTRDQNQKTRFENLRRGTMIAASIHGRITGLGGDRIVVDDPLNPMMAASPLERETVNRFFDQTLASRLDRPSEGAIVIVMQRLHENDLTGHLSDAGYTIVTVPSVAPKTETLTFRRSGRTITRQEGDLLWPERIPQSAIDEARTRLGPYGFAAQHQQSPMPLSGGVIKDAWWRFYRVSQRDIITQAATEIATFTDSAFETGEENDYSVTAVWARVRPNRFDVQPGFYLLDLWRERVEFPELKKLVPRTFHDWNARTLVVEKKASGHSLVQELRRIPLPVKTITPVKDKVARLNARTGWIEQGMVYLPDTHPLLDAFLEEHRTFPKSTHDDMVDTTSMMLEYWAGRTSWESVDPDGEPDDDWAEFFAEAGVA